MSGYRFILLILLIGLNGFFASAEVALLSVRQSKLKEMAKNGQAGAQSALLLLQNPERLLSVVQVGVTLASLGLGWAGEDALFHMFMRWFEPLQTPATIGIWHGASFAIAFLAMSYAHVVFGEVVPKNLAIEKADRLAMLVSPPLLVFYRIAEPFVAIIERSALFISRLIGLEGGHHGGGHSAEELKLIVSSSRLEGHLHTFEEDAIQRVLDLKEISAREIMVSRNAIVSVPVDAPIERVLQTLLDHQYSRMPVYEGTPENIIGIIHYKDLTRVWDERRRASERGRTGRAFRLRRLIRKPLVVPETKPLNQLAEEFRQHHTHMAIVVDEFGTISGLVTLEDVLEQVFGEIEDEHDEKRMRPQGDVFELDGATPIRDLDSLYGMTLPGDAGFETLAGFLLFRLGQIPTGGESVEAGGLRFTVIEMDRNRIRLVRAERRTAD